jgi:predicted Zn-dependent peptidase
MFIDNIINIFNDDMVGGAKSKNHSKFKKTELKLYDMSNGMKSLLIPLPDANTVTVGIFVNAGSRQETDSFGIAHFLEHTMFKGTTTSTSEYIMNKLDSLGANYNAMTGYDFTLYYISGDPRDIIELLSVVIDLYLNPAYPDAEIEKERNVVMEELKMNNDNNHRLLTNKMFEVIYNKTHPDLSRPIIGYERSVMNFKRSDILKFRKQCYDPSNCLISVVGNFDITDVLSTIECNFDAKLTEHLIRKNLFQDRIINDPKIEPLNCKTRHIHIEKNINQTIIYFFFGSYDKYNLYNQTLELLCNILSDGFSSRFFNLLRNKLGISYFNNSFVRTFHDCGQLITSVGVDPSSVVLAIESILNELKNIIKNGITENELEKAKKQSTVSILFDFKDPYDYMMYYGMNMLVKKPLHNISDMLAEIESVTMENINDVIKNVFTLDNLVVGSIGPKCDGNKITKIINDFI